MEDGGLNHVATPLNWTLVFEWVLIWQGLLLRMDGCKHSEVDQTSAMVYESRNFLS